MKKTFTKVLTAILVATLFAGTFAACGGKDNNQPTSTPTTAPADNNQNNENNDQNNDQNNNENNNENGNTENGDKVTVAATCIAVYKEKIAAGATVSEALAAIAEKLELWCEVETELPYIQGFDATIEGFTSYVALMPGFGGQPFIVYSFETTDAAALMTTLKEHADLRWNICTEADEMLCEEVNGRVIFVMAPFSFEEEDF